VRREQQIHRTAEEPDRREHDEHAEQRRAPQRLRCRLLCDEHRQGHRAHPPPRAGSVVVVVLTVPVPDWLLVDALPLGTFQVVPWIPVRSYSTMSSIICLVSILPNPGMRPDPMPPIPYCP